MNIGLLWFDDDPRHSLTDKVTEAAAHYQKRFGQSPTLCYVHPAALGQTEQHLVGGVQVAPGRTVLPNHLWLGVADA
jgi:hypothetical protein